MSKCERSAAVQATSVTGLIDAQIFWRRIFLVSSILFLVGMIFFAALRAAVPPPKQVEDYIREYVDARWNYTPDTAKNAYMNSLQYEPIAYEQLVKPELDSITQQGLYSFFSIDSIKKVAGKNIYSVTGHRLIYALKNGPVVKNGQVVDGVQYDVITDAPQTFNIGKNGNKFFETNS